MKTIRTQLSDPVAEALLDYAKRRGSTIASIVRDLVSNFVERKGLIKELKADISKRSKKTAEKPSKPKNERERRELEREREMHGRGREPKPEEEDEEPEESDDEDEEDDSEEDDEIFGDSDEESDNDEPIEPKSKKHR